MNYMGIPWRLAVMLYRAIRCATGHHHWVRHSRLVYVREADWTPSYQSVYAMCAWCRVIDWRTQHYETLHPSERHSSPTKTH